MKELQERLLALSADAYSQHQTRGDAFALRVADVTAGLALMVKQLAAERERYPMRIDRATGRAAGAPAEPA